MHTVCDYQTGPGIVLGTIRRANSHTRPSLAELSLKEVGASRATGCVDGIDQEERTQKN